MVSINKFTQTLLFVFLTIALMVILKGFLIPLFYGLLLALIIYPVCKNLEKRKVPRPFAIFISMLMVAVVLGSILYIFILQLSVINSELPELSLRLEQLVIKFQSWVTKNLGMSVVEQDNLMIDTGKNMLTSLGEIIKGSFSIAAATIFNIVIIPLYATLFLSNRGKLVQFISSFFESNQKVRLQTILTETIRIYFNYIKGMLKVYLIVGILNSFGLWILGVDYPFLFGMATAFMTIIPYIGIMVSAMLPMSMVWIETNNYLYPLGVMGMFALVQYLEANLIFPYVVGKQLGVNMLVSICAIFLGGVLWGVSGMILFLPFVAMLRIISGHFEKLQPLFKLLKSNE